MSCTGGLHSCWFSSTSLQSGSVERSYSPNLTATISYPAGSFVIQCAQVRTYLLEIKDAPHVNLKIRPVWYLMRPIHGNSLISALLPPTILLDCSTFPHVVTLRSSTPRLLRNLGSTPSCSVLLSSMYFLGQQTPSSLRLMMFEATVVKHLIWSRYASSFRESGFGASR